MDKQGNFPVAGEGALLVLHVLFPQIDAQAVPHHVVFFTLNVIRRSTGLLSSGTAAGAHYGHKNGHAKN
jgi:hypothetical protein